MSTTHMFSLRNKKRYQQFSDEKKCLICCYGIHIVLFLFLTEYICCGYSLEAPHQGMSTQNK